MNQKYTMAENPQPTITWDEYEKFIVESYNNMLENHGDDERRFQEFFEENPSFVPGPFQLIGTSGHCPYLNCLISQPDIGGIFTRKPDFVWLAQDSLTFSPVLIEIEKPNKKTFNNDGRPSADFNQAFDQIREWKMILNNPLNLQLFYAFFEVPNYMREKKFSPQYGLIYGRRSEYEGIEFLTRKRADLQSPDTIIMSYDRLRPNYHCSDLLCAKIEPSRIIPRYHIITIPATYMYSPFNSEDLCKVSDFYERIDEMKYTSIERKHFLKDRYSYWVNYGKKEKKGIMSSGDRE